MNTLPEKTYEVNQTMVYCGYWFFPDNGTDFRYFYSFTIKAVLSVGGTTDERKITVEFKGSEVSQ